MEEESESIGVSIMEDNMSNKLDKKNVYSNSNNPRNKMLSEEVFNGFCLLVTTIILTLTYILSPYSNMVSNISVMAALNFALYVAVRKITGRRGAPDWIRNVVSNIAHAAIESDEPNQDKKQYKVKKKCKWLWEKVKRSDKAVDFTFVGIIILASTITMTVSENWDYLFICMLVLAILYLVVRALTGRLRILSAEETIFKHMANNIQTCGTILLASGSLLCFSEFGLDRSDHWNLKFRTIAPCAVALGLANIGLGLVKPTRVSNFIFCLVNAFACACGTLYAWADYGPNSIARDYYYHNLFEKDAIFMDFQTTVPTALRLLCPTINFTTTLLISIMMGFSIISFKRKQDEKVKKKKGAFSKLMVSIYGLMLFIVTIYKIWNISNSLFMPGPMDKRSVQDVLITTTTMNYQTATFTALIAASYLSMRCAGKLEVIMLMALASITLITDYIAISQYDPDNSLNDLQYKLNGLMGCPSEYGSDMYCYYVKNQDKECIPANRFCNGVIDIKKKVSIISSQDCDTVNDTVEAYTYTTTTPRNHVYEYDEEYIQAAADEVFCHIYYEPYINAWSLCALVSCVLCSLIILTAAFIPFHEKITNKFHYWNSLQKEGVKKEEEAKEEEA